MDPGSSDVALLCRAPQVVSEAYRRARSTIGDARDLLSWRLGFVDTVQRFLVAVLAAEHAGLGLPAPKELTLLLTRLEAPSLGHWGRAAYALAEILLASGRTLAARPLAEALCAQADDGCLSPSSLVRDLIEIVETRNELVHGGTVGLPDEGTARAELDAIEGPLRRVCASVAVLHRYPVFYVRSRRERQDGTVTATVVGFAGSEPHQVTLQDARGLKVPERVPFVRGDQDEALLLSPFLVVARQAGTGVLETRLLYSWNTHAARFDYSELRTNEHGRADLEGDGEDEDAGNPLTRLRARPSAAGRREGAAPASLSELVFGPETAGLPTISGYAIDGVLGRGATGVVYAARETRSGDTGPLVALKRLDPAVAHHHRDRLRREHDVLRRLEHPAIVRALGFVDNAAQGTFLVMEYVQGEDLQRRVERGPLPLGEAIRIVRDVLGALAAAHAVDVVHRDVKPSNVIVEPSGAVRLIDFGVAMAQDELRLTRTLDVVGTLDYASPEQQRGSAEPRSDVYSVGRLLAYLVRGMIDAAGSPTNLPAGLHAVVRRATQPQPWDRFGSAIEMLEALSERERARWHGAPVQSGDRLDESYTLGAVLGDSVRGVTVCAGTEELTDDPVAIGLAVLGSPAGARLREAFRRCSPQVRRELGARSLQRTRDGLVFAVFDDGDAPSRVRALLRESEPEHVEHDPTLQRRAPFLEPVLRGLSHLARLPWNNSIAGAAERARWLLQLLNDVDDRKAPMAERLARWRLRSSAPLATVVTGAEAANRLPQELAKEFLALAEARNAAARGETTTIPILGFSEALTRLVEFVDQRVTGLAPVDLSPMVLELDGRWALLELLGKHVDYLDLETAAELRAPLEALRAIEGAGSGAAVHRIAGQEAVRLLRGAQVEVRDHVVWITHIAGDHALVQQLHALRADQSIELRVDGVIGTWARMRDGCDGRPTLGLRPLGSTADDWARTYERRQARPLVDFALASVADASPVLPANASPPAGAPP